MVTDLGGRRSSNPEESPVSLHRRDTRSDIRCRWMSDGERAMGMMNDDESCWWVEKKVRLGGEQEKGEMRVLAETCRPPRHAAK